jgi:hypothetical protein
LAERADSFGLTPSPGGDYRHAHRIHHQSPTPTTPLFAGPYPLRYFAAKFGDGNGEDKRICVVRKFEETKDLAICSVGHYDSQ